MHELASSTLVRDQLPSTSHRRTQALRAEDERRGRAVTGWDRLRHLLTIPTA